MINQDTFGGYSKELVDVMENVQIAMMTKIARQLAQGKELTDDDWKVLMLRRYGLLNDSLKSILKGSVEEQVKAMDEATKKAIYEGVKDTDKQLAGTVSTADKFVEHNQMILGEIGKQMNRDITKANLTMLQKASESYLDVVNRVLSVKEAGAITRTEATKQVLTQWAQKGIPALVDRSGREWQADAYVNMVVRTNSLQVAKEAQNRRSQEYGHDLIITSQHSDQSSEHAPYANKIYSLSGNDPKYPPFSQATSAGFMTRPNCRHYYEFYIPGMSKKPKPMPKRDTDKNYKLSQQQRKLERDIRKEKRVIETLKSAGLETDNTKLRTLQADMREFINATDRTRRREREQI